jgi:hypothetical protein
MLQQRFSYYLKSRLPIGEIKVLPESEKRLFQVWDEISKIVSSADFYFNDHKVILTVDWGNTLDGFRYLMEFEQALYSMPDSKKANEHLNSYKTPEILIQFHIEGAKDEIEELGCITNFLYHVFLAINLSLPGACDFRDALVYPKTPDAETSQRYNNHFPYHVDLFTTIFEYGLDSSIEMKWPLISAIPLTDVWLWLQRVDHLTSSNAKTSAQKALYALLHCCLIPIKPYSDLIELVWFAHAMESLYETPSDAILKTLRERIFLLLGEPVENGKKIRKLINQFYDLRSSFVHGDYEILKPSWLSIESSILAYDREGRDKSKFLIASILIATLQKMILNSWSGLLFHELFSGISTKQNILGIQENGEDT